VATEYAYTQILHGKEDGKQVVVEEGDQLPAGVFSDDQLEELRASKSVGPKLVVVGTVDDEIAARDKEIARLKAELAAAQSGSKSSSASFTGKQA